MSSSLRGHFLIAAKSLRDPNFLKTVVLIIEHNSEGAAGIVLNRPSSVLVSHALSGQFNLSDSDQVIYVGGPVEPQSLILIHGSSEVGANESSPANGVFIGGTSETFEQVLKSADAFDSEPIPYRLLSGYAGWSAGQLECEIERGDWLTYPSCASLVFDENPYDLYERVFELVLQSDSVMPYRIKDVSVN